MDLGDTEGFVLYVCTYIYRCLYTHITSTYVYMYIYIFLCIHIYEYTHTHIFIHTYTLPIGNPRDKEQIRAHGFGHQTIGDLQELRESCGGCEALKP